MKILVFGKTGQVAIELARLAPKVQISGSVPEAHFADRAAADLGNPAACASLIAQLEPDLIINAAAYTNVDRAEAEEPLAQIVNGTAPAAMAAAAKQIGAAFVHLSTDYVFDGSGEAPWTPDAAPAPLGAYGRSKLVGERGVIRADGAHAILRTAWVFSAHGSNFVETMLRLGKARDEIDVVADQYGGPTPAADIAAACLGVGRALVADPGKSGTYHFTGAPDTHWADFARAIMAEAGLDCTVNDIPSSAYPTPAARPGNSRLDCSTTQTVFGIDRPDWHVGLRAVISELEQT